MTYVFRLPAEEWDEHLKDTKSVGPRTITLFARIVPVYPPAPVEECVVNLHDTKSLRLRIIRLLRLIPQVHMYLRSISHASVRYIPHTSV
jgi:hypothetical protein